MAESAVQLGIAGRVAGHVLSTQFVLNLLKGVLKLLAVVAYVDHPSAGLFRHLLRSRISAVAETEVSIKACVGDQDHVNNGIGLLSGGNRIVNLDSAAFVLAVRQDDHRLAARFLIELFV